jgi:hypothetical protein
MIGHLHSKQFSILVRSQKIEEDPISGCSDIPILIIGVNVHFWFVSISLSLKFEEYVYSGCRDIPQILIF